MGKIVSKEDFRQLRKSMFGKKVVLCHGVFDVVHPGHMIHFKEAKSLGDILVVSVTAAEYVRKGPNRPYFNDEMRLKFLAQIDLIDYVILSENYTVDDIIDCIRPSLYVKGKEYSDSRNDVTGMIEAEVKLVRKYGGDVYYTDGAVFSSTKLINNYFKALKLEEKEYVKKYRGTLNMEKIKRYVDKISQLHILVIGDAIIDQYSFCKVNGIMSKDLGYSATYDYEESYLGGTFAVARHIRELSRHVSLATIMGTEENYAEELADLEKQISLEIIQCKEFKTIVKHKYVEEASQNEALHKIFSIQNASENNKISKESSSEFALHLRKIIEEYDLVIVCDYGHGLVSKEVQEELEKRANLLVVNCQTNSANYGRNPLTKYNRLDAFSINKKELRLVSKEMEQTLENRFYELCKKYHSTGWYTCGKDGAYGATSDGMKIYVPGLGNTVKDTIGAGDTFFAISSLFYAVGAEVEVSTFMGNVAGRMATDIIGNKETVCKVNLLKYVSTILNI